MAKLKSLFVAFLTIAASAQKLGINLIRVAILVIFVWIGGLKFWNYEAEGIVPFVANSPFMSFFYTKDAPEYKEYKLKEGELDETKHLWHEENYNPQIQISAESETKRSIFREKDKTKRSKKESAQHSKSRNKSFVMTSVSAL